MTDIPYRKVIEYQNRIVELKETIETVISYVDDDGCRKIKPEHFLSGEIAAYKFLSSWVKRMIKGETVIDAEVIRVIGDIENLLYWSKGGDFSDQEAIIEYEVLNTILWIDLLSNKELAPSFEFNNIIVGLAAISLMEKGVPDEMNHYMIYDYEDLLDGSAIGEAYSVAHEWILSKPRELLLELMNKTEIHRFHFNILN